VGDRAVMVDDPAEADVAVLRLTAPFEPRGEAGTLESFFHAGSLDFPNDEIERVTRICRAVPTVVDVYLDRPAILTGLAAEADTLIVNFGATETACCRILFGEAEPLGKLPFDLPSSMAAVTASRCDVAFDTTDPLFRFGFGLSYTDFTPAPPYTPAAEADDSPVGRFDLDRITVGPLLDDLQAHAILAQHMPDLLADEIRETVASLPFALVLQMAEHLTDDEAAGVRAQLAALPPLRED
jgi:beta-glucosidase